MSNKQQKARRRPRRWPARAPLRSLAAALTIARSVPWSSVTHDGNAGLIQFAMSLSAITGRRRLLQIAAANAACFWLPRSTWGQPRWPFYPFGLGVASGSPTQDSVVLWTRLLAQGSLHSLGKQPITLRWELAHDDRFARVAHSGQVQALPELAHSAHVEVRGLEPDRWYYYRFMIGDAVSPAGRTRTFPSPQAAVARLRLAYASCQRWEHGYFSAWRHMREENPDVVLFLGDYIYEYPNAANAVRVPAGGWVLTLDD